MTHAHLPVALALALVVLVGGCAPRDMADGPSVAGGERAAAVVPLSDANGRVTARAELAQVGDGVRVEVAAEGLAAGTYGFHVHMVGRCDAPGFTSAGEHWNPTARQHGRDNPAGAHVGDLPNLIVGTDGRGTVAFTMAGATIDGGARPMLDADGASLMIHAAADDYRTDPSGNSGARIACGVVRG